MGATSDIGNLCMWHMANWGGVGSIVVERAGNRNQSSSLVREDQTGKRKQIR